MRQKLTALFTAACLIYLCLPMVFAADTQPKNPTLEQLDLNGDLVLFMNTETIERSVLEYIDTMARVVLGTLPDSAPPLQREIIEGAVDKIKTGIEWSGLLSVQSYAASMAPVDGNLNRVITIVKHAEADGAKPLWRIASSDPKVMTGIHYAPTNAVYTVNSTASLDEAWKILNEAITTFYTPQQVAAFNQKVAMFEMILGTNVTAITGSLDNEILLSIQFSEDRNVTIPQGMTTLTLPEPNLLIGFKTKEPLLGNILLEKLKLTQMPVVDSDHGAYTLHTLYLPIPLPVPVQPTLIMTEDYLLIGSDPSVVVAALDSRANSNGLVSTPLYQKLLAGVPEKTSSIEFMSPRFMQTYVEIMKQAVATDQDPSSSVVMDVMMTNYKNMYSGGYSLKTPTGIYSKSHVDYGGAKPIDLVASAYAGMLSAIAVPSFQKARSNSQDKGCLNNLRILSAAKEQWAMENGKAEGDIVEEADVSVYIKGGFPALQCPKGGSYTINPIGTAPTCSTHTM